MTRGHLYNPCYMHTSLLEKVQLNVPSDRSIFRQLGIPIYTGKRFLKLVFKKRKKVRHGVFISSWSQVKSRAGFWTKVDQKLRTKIDAWIDTPSMLYTSQFQRIHYCKSIVYPLKLGCVQHGGCI